MKKPFNRNSITVKSDSVYTESFDELSYDERATEWKYKVLSILLDSANPFKAELDLTNEDFKAIEIYRDSFKTLCSDLEVYLKTK